MYYSYVEIEYVAKSFSPARMDLALNLLSMDKSVEDIQRYVSSMDTSVE